jgi:hypothetical protein
VVDEAGGAVVGAAAGPLVGAPVDVVGDDVVVWREAARWDGVGPLSAPE